METVSASPGGILALPCADVGVVTVTVEIARVIARVVEDAIEDNRNSVLFRCLAELDKIALGAECGVDFEVVGSIVPMAALGLKDGIEIDRCESKLRDSRKVLLNTLERATVEIPARNGVVRVSVVSGRGVPIVDDTPGDPFAGNGECGFGTLSPVLIAGVSIGEDLIDHSLLIPSGACASMFVDRDLERRHVQSVVGYRFSALVAILGSHAQDAPTGQRDDKAIPNDLRLIPGFGDAVESIALRFEWIQAFVLVFCPGSQVD